MQSVNPPVDEPTSMQVLPASDIPHCSGRVVCLVKPQFEAGREQVGKKGVVRDKKVHLEVIHPFFSRQDTIWLAIKTMASLSLFVIIQKCSIIANPHLSRLLCACLVISAASCILCLVKPQFEAGREKVGKKGVVRDQAVPGLLHTQYHLVSLTHL